jgi:hypothetical protein
MTVPGVEQSSFQFDLIEDCLVATFLTILCMKEGPACRRAISFSLVVFRERLPASTT